MLESLGNLRLTFLQPWWLLLIPVLLPPLVLLSLRSLSGLGNVRRALAILLRSAVVSLIALALADPQLVRRNESLTTIFLLDASRSIPGDLQAPMLGFINRAILQHQRPGDRAGVIVFGKEAKVESPPAPYTETLTGVESTIDAEYTDLSSAIKLALASFPDDTARRIVVLSDGNENRGDAYEQALAAAGLGVQIDVLPVDYNYDREVLVEKIALPPDVKKGETVNINVVVRAAAPATGRLEIFQKADNSTIPIDTLEGVELQRGVNVFRIKQEISDPNFYTYSAQFIPEEELRRGLRADRAMNNMAEGFTQYRGEANVLLIEGTAGEHEELVDALRSKELNVTTLAAGDVTGDGLVGGDPLPTDLAELQKYDAIILANVPKDAFTDGQQDLIATAVHDQGIGLLMIGGDRGFGAGGWMNTPIEKALPVDMQIPALKVKGKAAMVMIMHASEIPEGNYWQAVVAQEALKTLSSYDYAGLLHWQGQESWLFTLREIGSSKPAMLRAIDRMTPGDMPDMNPSLVMAGRALQQKRDAMSRHIIIISDGDPTAPTPQVINQLKAAKVTVTTVLTAAHGNDIRALQVMQQLAQQTKGRFYNVTNPRALPRIYQKEARLISRPLIFEGPPPAWNPVLAYQSEPLLGLPQDLPPISGLVLSSIKENELVEVPITSPNPTGQVNPVLAHWSYGLGRSVAFTSDAGRKWTANWRNWDSYAAFWSQVVRWALRPVDRGNLNVSLRREEGRIKVVVDAVDAENQFLNFLQFQGIVNRPDRQPDAPADRVELVQVAPGKYEGTIENAEARGNYFVTLGYRGPDGEQGVLTTGLSVPYSDEYRDLRSNPVLLESLADATGGAIFSWETGPDGRLNGEQTAMKADVFRRDRGVEPPKSYRPIWHWLLWCAALIFVGDVGVRRIAPDFDRLRRNLSDAMRKLRGKEVAPREEYIEKLKSRKLEVGQQIDRTRAATRFEAPAVPPPSGGPSPTSAPTSGPARPADRPRPSADASRGPGLGPDQPKAPGGGEAESYTNRLLKAKKKVWEEREPDKEKGKGGTP
ncbi:VWA domain-containing protein [Tautonia sociabilis]|uniref:VWA domain-containing protein n=1 Tax=Tautonia sociabilis TaxID=2080755 RepID=A0A432MFX5_9BACT|nr:VWA domain-containing protein [Tautonia sociabilis]RUL85071.1 VWA domain-containing protein [Tautonia sociabilis]